MLYSRSKDYMFRPVVTIIRSLSFDTLKSIYSIVWWLFDVTNCTFRLIKWLTHTTNIDMSRSPHQTRHHTIV